MILRPWYWPQPLSVPYDMSFLAFIPVVHDMFLTITAPWYPCYFSYHDPPCSLWHIPCYHSSLIFMTCSCSRFFSALQYIFMTNTFYLLSVINSWPRCPPLLHVMFLATILPCSLWLVFYYHSSLITIICLRPWFLSANKEIFPQKSNYLLVIMAPPCSSWYVP